MNINMNINLIVGLGAIFIILWLIIYIIPSFFSYLFNTLLGQIILVMLVIIAGYYKLAVGLILAILFIILYQFANMKESFDLSSISIPDISLDKNPAYQYLEPLPTDYKISQGSIDDLLAYYNKKSVEINQPQITEEQLLNDPGFKPILENVTDEEVQYFIKNDKWPWDSYVQDTIKKQLVDQGISDEDVLNNLELWQTTIPNRGAYQMWLFRYTPQGKLLANPSNLKIDDTKKIMCSGSTVQMANYANNIWTTDEPTQDYNIFLQIPGFSFVKSSCNICDNAICPFKMDGQVDPALATYWGVPASTLISTPEVIATAPANTGTFPILNQLKSELNQISI